MKKLAGGRGCRWCSASCIALEVIIQPAKGQGRSDFASGGSLCILFLSFLFTFLLKSMTAFLSRVQRHDHDPNQTLDIIS
jgi:hypothetical protein